MQTDKAKQKELRYAARGYSGKPGDGLISFFMGEDNWFRGDGNIYDKKVKSMGLDKNIEDPLLSLSKPISNRDELAAFNKEHGNLKTLGNLGQGVLGNWALPAKVAGAIARPIWKITPPKAKKYIKGAAVTGATSLAGWLGYDALYGE